jgi:hypothetical protein
MSRPRRSLNDLQRAEMRRRRREERTKLLPLAVEFGVCLWTAHTVCRRIQAPVDRLDHAAARDIALETAAAFGFTLAEIQQSPGPGQPATGNVLAQARAAALVGMRAEPAPIAWEVIEDVMAPGGGQHRRLVLQRLLRRAIAAGIPAVTAIGGRKTA